MPQTSLPDRAVIVLSGEDRLAFLQGLVSNDVAQAAPGRAVWAALLTPQGKWLADFFVFADDGRLLLDAEAAQAEMLVQRLSRFRLRSKVALALAPELGVAAGWGGAPLPAGIAAPDPRHPGAGWRALLPEPPAGDATPADYNRHRLSLGLPAGSQDLDSEKSVLLEAGFDELAGVSWSKGCYMGQELTARTKYRGLLKKRLFPVAVEGPLPPRGTPVLREDGAELGEMRSGQEGLGLALLRMPVEPGQALRCGDAVLRPGIPDWMAPPPRD
jgi:folate-binding protein YgfZ